jgi:hypothetical protein
MQNAAIGGGSDILLYVPPECKSCLCPFDSPDLMQCRNILIEFRELFRYDFYSV